MLHATTHSTSVEPSEQIPLNALKDKSLKTNAGLRMDAKIAPSTKTMIYAHPSHAIARPPRAKTSNNSVTAIAMIAMMMNTKLKTQLKTSRKELTPKLTRQSVTFSATSSRDVFQAPSRDAFPCDQLVSSIIYDSITNLYAR